ncbi:VWA domain-containing protein [Microbacterium sediminis]|uniref:Uncharacterized protein n=1 Tax=Microbacterium sediminis TaxID=904291 RepID=A0A1B9NIP9_9MICO|nr:VWA domain-containing protein [Microbacterium sediminis]OCG76487.1 hypothetical protein A7J15_11945 [Microbacterium sediminis]QBR73063.1 VWA domain-containing protein [Microbacterium sediminis]
MALTSIWPIVAVAALIVVAAAAGLAWGLRRSGRDRGGDGVLVARAERLRELPAVRAATRRRAVGLGAIALLAGASALAGSVVIARPMASQTIVPENTSRDIMLCLDVSGSMTEVDKEVLDVFLELVDGFEGERIGLTIFNASPVQVFPLTDDYAFVREHLRSMRESFEYGDVTPEHWQGTLDGPGASLIGDGLAACALRFDHSDEERSRSIILATDNEVAGASVLTLQEAADYSASVGVRVFALNPIQDDGAVAQELVAAAEATGGAAYGLRGTTTVGDIVDRVQEQEATALRGEIEVVWTDEPTVWIVVVLMLALVLVVIGWRVRL